MAVFTIFGPRQIHYFWPFSPFWDLEGFIIFGRFHHFLILTYLLFFAVFTIFGPGQIYYFWPLSPFLDPDGFDMFGRFHHSGP